LSLFIQNSRFSCADGGLVEVCGNQAAKAAARVVEINGYPAASICWVLGGYVNTLYSISYFSQKIYRRI
jgi:hypothetical protein